MVFVIFCNVVIAEIASAMRTDSNCRDHFAHYGEIAECVVMTEKDLSILSWMCKIWQFMGSLLGCFASGFGSSLKPKNSCKWFLACFSFFWCSPWSIRVSSLLHCRKNARDMDVSMFFPHFLTSSVSLNACRERSASLVHPELGFCNWPVNTVQLTTLCTWRILEIYQAI